MYVCMYMQALAGVCSSSKEHKLYLLVIGLCRCGWEGSRMACVGGEGQHNTPSNTTLTQTGTADKIHGHSATMNDIT